MSRRKTSKKDVGLSRDLGKEISRSILLTEKEKTFWLARLPSLPRTLMGIVLKMIRGRNKIVDRYIETALAGKDGRNAMADLKIRIVAIKRHAWEMEEAAEIKKNEGTLDQLL